MECVLAQERGNSLSMSGRFPKRSSMRTYVHIDGHDGEKAEILDTRQALRHGEIEPAKGHAGVEQFHCITRLRPYHLVAFVAEGKEKMEWLC